MNAFKEYEILAGSSRAPFGGEPAGRPHVEQEIDVTILIRRPKQLSPSALTFGRQFLTRRMLQFLYCADQPDLDLLVQFAVHYHLTVVELNKVKRLAVLRGTIEQVETAFRVQLTLKYKMGRVHRVRSGPVMIPKELGGIVVGVFGLDERPQARPHFRLSRSRVGLPIKPNAFDGNQLATIYDFPKNQGLGETIALIELGGAYREIDIQRFFTTLGLPCPTVISVPVAGATNAPGIGESDIEVALDIAVAPLFAGLTARINCALGRMVGLINPALYAAGLNGGFNDIVTGNNSADGIQGYFASPGWDAVTGWGSPGGNALLRLLSNSIR